MMDYSKFTVLNESVAEVTQSVDVMENTDAGMPSSVTCTECNNENEPQTVHIEMSLLVHNEASSSELQTQTSDSPKQIENLIFEQEMIKNKQKIIGNGVLSELEHASNSNGISVVKRTDIDRTKTDSFNYSGYENEVNVDPLKDEAQGETINLIDEELPHKNLPRINLQMIRSDLSHQSDTDACPSHVPSPCSVLPEEMSITSPKMMFSFMSDTEHSEDLLSENNIVNICSSVSLGTGGGNQPFYIEVNNDEVEICNLNARSKRASEDTTNPEGQCQVLITNQILSKTEILNMENGVTGMTNVKSSDIILESNLQLQVQQSALLSPRDFPENYTQDIRTTLTELPFLNCNFLVSESVAPKDAGNKSVRVLVTNLGENTVSLEDEHFAEKHPTKDHFNEPRVPVMRTPCEDQTTDYEILHEDDIPERDNSEQNMTPIENEIINISSSTEGVDQASHTNMSTDCISHSIIKELSSLSASYDYAFDNNDYRYRKEKMPFFSYSDHLNPRIECARPGTSFELSHFSSELEIKDMKERSYGTDSHITKNEERKDDSSCVEIPLRKSETALQGTDTCMNIDDCERDLLPENEIFFQAVSASFEESGDSSEEDEYFMRNEDDDPYKEIFVRESDNTKRIAECGGIFKTSKEKLENPRQKRVSFRFDNSTNDKSDFEDMSENITDENQSSRKSFVQRKTFSEGLRFINAGRKNGRRRSNETTLPQILSERFRSSISLPSQNELIIPSKCTTREDIDNFHLNFTTVNNDENNESKNGKTNMAFIESPMIKYSDEHEDTEDDSDEDCDIIFEVNIPKGSINSSHGINLLEKRRAPPSVRHHSDAEATDYSAVNKHDRFLKKWYSSEGSPSESSPLTVSSSHTKNPSNESPPRKVTFSSQEIVDDFDDLVETYDRDEDTLSLEFSIPGRKKFIRLHRSTFFHFLLKYSIFIFTFLFWVVSLFGICFAAWMLTSSIAIMDGVSDIFIDPYVLLCVVSAIMFLVAFLGCVGALRENICLLKVFHISLTVVLVLEVLLSLLVLLFYTMPEFRTMVKVGPEKVLKKAVREYFDNEVLQNWIDMVQKRFQCCGVSMSDHGYLDWKENQYYNCTSSNPSVYRCSVPISCCIFHPGDYINYMCGAGIIQEDKTEVIHKINTIGCMKKFGDWLGKNYAVIGYSAVGVIIPQILGVIAARFFIKQLIARQTSWQLLNDPLQVTPT